MKPLLPLGQSLLFLFHIFDKPCQALDFQLKVLTMAAVLKGDLMVLVPLIELFAQNLKTTLIHKEPRRDRLCVSLISFNGPTQGRPQHQCNIFFKSLLIAAEALPAL